MSGWKVYPAQEVWQFEGIGLVLGINFITVNALGSQDGEDKLPDPAKQDVVAKATVNMMNFNQKNMETAGIDLSDTDGDGLNNYFESVYGTDPLLSDTDDNGIGDGEEDPDMDSLSNQEEFAAGTGVLYSDSDGDGLSDGDEALVYHTDPLAEDTDGDGLRDGEDINLGFDPLKPDTDENGILDGTR